MLILVNSIAVVSLLLLAPIGLKLFGFLVALAHFSLKDLGLIP